MIKDMDNKSIIDLYAMHRRWVSSGVDASKPITLLSDDEVTAIESAIKAATPSMSPLERVALQGRIDGLTGDQMAKVTGYHAAYIRQAINAAIDKIKFAALEQLEGGDIK